MAEFVPPDFEVPLKLETLSSSSNRLGLSTTSRITTRLDVVDGAHRGDAFRSLTAPGRER